MASTGTAPRARWERGELPPDLPIRQLGDPVLRTAAEPVTAFDDELRRLVEVMFASMYAAEGVGLAANQIGVGRSVFVMDCQGVVAVVCNPRLVEVSGETAEEPEGCLSVLGFSYPTPRGVHAVVQGEDSDGTPIVVEGDGEVARCLQHETDHLAGKLYIDRLRGSARRQSRRDLDVAPPVRTAPRALSSIFRRPSPG